MTDTATAPTALRLEAVDDVGVIWFDRPGESVNALGPELEDDLTSVLEALADDPALVAGVIISGKPDSFVVGADVDVLSDVLGDADRAAQLARTAQGLMDRIAASPKPIVAAIHGDCLGGGLELAMACRARIASDHPATSLGQPEVQLGLIPAAGGTQRLPRLIGLEKALDLILTGRQIDARRAARWGLVNEAVHPAILLDVATQHARRLARGEQPEPTDGLGERLRRLALQDNPAGRRLALGQARSRTLERTHGNLPAPLRAIEAIRAGLEEGMTAGLAAEAEAFGRLATTPQTESLIAVFRGRTRANRLAREQASQARDVREVMVVGAGLMGAGIAGVTASHLQVPVVLQDVSDDALRRGLGSIRGYLDHRRRSRKISRHERDRLMNLIHPTTGGDRRLDRVDLVIEAVVEDVDVKHQVIRSLEERLPAEAVIASNTSSIPITRLAEASSRPGQVVGMHYFSPVPQIPLLEVIRHEGTEDWVVATAVDVGRRQGKTVIVVSDGPGFYTSRILAPYMNEATELLADGATIEQVDRCFERLGFPVGPFRLADEVGIDVGAEIGEIMVDALGERLRPGPMLERLVADGRKGRKNGRGFYRYERDDGGWKRTEVDDTVYALLDSRSDTAPPDGEVMERGLLAMLNEAAWTLSDGVLHHPVDGDVGAVFGLGFPPHLGGPFRELDRRGPARVAERLTQLTEAHGPRFEPSPNLTDPFHGDE